MKRSADKRSKAYRFGLAAEKAASWYLRCKGYRILAERYRNRSGEIDILARRGKTVLVVEVKARQTHAACEYSITPAKQMMLSRAANELLGSHGKVAGLGDLATCNIRFDVVWIAPWRLPMHIKDAWRL